MNAAAHASLLTGFRKGLRNGTISLPMPFAVVASLLLHAVVLAMTFAGAPPLPNVEDRRLEVVLVNARHARAPERAEVLAQANLDGGGPVSEEARTSTPTPVMPARQDGDAPLEQRRIAAPAPRPVAPRTDDAALPTVTPAPRLRPEPAPQPASQPAAAPVRQPPPAALPEPSAPPPAPTAVTSVPPQPQRPARTPDEPAAPTVTLDAPQPQPPTTFVAAIKPIALPEPSSASPSEPERVTIALAAPEPSRREATEATARPALSAPERPRQRSDPTPADATAPARANPPPARSAPPPVPADPAPARQAPMPDAASTPADAPESTAAPAPSPAEPAPAPAAPADPAPAPREAGDPAPPSQPAPVARAPEVPETPAPPAEPLPVPDVSGLDVMDSIAAIAQLEARIGRQLDEYSKRPRKVHIGARAKEYRFAQYAEDWRQKVERIGTLNYPDAARGRIYGSLVMTVEIRADGTVERVEVDRSSGHQVLDDAAVSIVRMAAPYSPFPPDIRADTDRVVITRTWTFTNSDQLQTR